MCVSSPATQVRPEVFARHAKGKTSFSLRWCAGKKPQSQRVSLPFEGHSLPATAGGRDASTPHTQVRWVISDTQTDMLLGEPKSAICVQRFDDSLNSAIHTSYRRWLRSSSMRDQEIHRQKFSIFFRLSLRGGAQTRATHERSLQTLLSMLVKKHWRGWTGGRRSSTALRSTAI